MLTCFGASEFQSSGVSSIGLNFQFLSVPVFGASVYSVFSTRSLVVSALPI